MKTIALVIMVGDRRTADDGRVIWDFHTQRQEVVGTYESDAAGMAAELLAQAKRQLDRMIAEHDALMARKIG